MAEIKKKFKLTFHPLSQMVLIVAGILALFSLVSIGFIDVQYILLIDAAAILVFLFMAFPNIGIYLMALLFPFWGLEFRWGEINVPYVDIVALLMFAALLIRTSFYWINTRLGIKFDKEKFVYFRKFPGWGLFLVFFVAAIFSITQNDQMFAAFKYLLRPILFFYLMYIVIPVNVIKEKTIFIRTLYLILISGVVTTLLGLASVFLNSGSWFDRRALPFSFLGINPLGGNHNAIAEILIVALPLIFILFFLTKRIRHRGWYIIVALLIVLVLLLTFSRSGWLTLILEIVILYLLQYRKKLNKYSIIALCLIIVFSLSLFYVVVWSQVSQVQGSTSSRWLMTDVAWSYFVDKPMLGHGLNMFSTMLGNTFVYWVEFGDPLDSHGFIQKILVENGLLGLLAFLSFITFLFYYFYNAFKKCRTFESRVVVGSLLVMFVGVVFFQLFSTSYYIAKLWFPIGVGLAGLGLYQNKKLSSKN